MTVPRAEGSKPLRKSKAYERADVFLQGLDGLLTPVPEITGVEITFGADTGENSEPRTFL